MLNNHHLFYGMCGSITPHLQWLHLTNTEVTHVYVRGLRSSPPCLRIRREFGGLQSTRLTTLAFFICVRSTTSMLICNVIGTVENFQVLAEPIYFVIYVQISLKESIHLRAGRVSDSGYCARGLEVNGLGFELHPSSKCGRISTCIAGAPS